MSYKEIQSTIHQLRDKLEKLLTSTASTAQTDRSSTTKSSTDVSYEKNRSTTTTSSNNSSSTSSTGLPPDSPIHTVIIRLYSAINDLTVSIAHYDSYQLTTQIYQDLMERLHRIEIMYENLTVYNFIETTYTTMQRLLCFLQSQVGTNALLSTPLSLLQRTITELHTSIGHLHDVYMQHYCTENFTGSSNSNNIVGLIKPDITLLPSGESTGSSRNLPLLLKSLTISTLHETIRLSILTIDSLGFVQSLPPTVAVPLQKIIIELHTIMVDIDDYFRMNPSVSKVSVTLSTSSHHPSSDPSLSFVSPSTSINRIDSFLSIVKQASETILYWGIDFTIEQYLALDHYFDIRNKLLHYYDHYRIDPKIRSVTTTLTNYLHYAHPLTLGIQNTLLRWDTRYLHGKGTLYTHTGIAITDNAAQYFMDRYRTLSYRTERMKSGTISSIPGSSRSSASSYNRSPVPPSSSVVDDRHAFTPSTTVTTIRESTLLSHHETEDTYKSSTNKRNIHNRRHKHPP